MTTDRTSDRPLRLLSRRAKHWRELLHCSPDQMPLVGDLVALVLMIDPDVQMELRTIAGERLGAVGRSDLVSPVSHPDPAS